MEGIFARLRVGGGGEPRDSCDVERANSSEGVAGQDIPRGALRDRGARARGCQGGPSGIGYPNGGQGEQHRAVERGR